jgi:alanyl-tRNA synthetase
MLTSDIRRCFLSFFENNGHKIIESSPVVPANDPSLLFTNAGMVQFKNVFVGLETRSYKRATTSQKCIRAGGKHNDLDQVGFTARHHTFFEMLGNFSFGDYFKDDAINFAWTFLTKELGISRDKLSITIFHTDDEAKAIWEKVAGNVAIIPISTNDNFWSMGDTGPCGPCSEIFYDHGENIPGDLPGTAGGDGDRYTEIWNIVFMQFEQKQNGEKIPLQKRSIDTGIGLERLAAVMQGVSDNYQIDLFKNLINEIKIISKTSYHDKHPSYKVIADHIRSVSFLIADGVIPSNEGRGYVLRRILRRAMRHGNLLNIKEPFMSKLSGTLVEAMRDAYPELAKAHLAIESTIRLEEENFLDTLERGLKILQNDISDIQSGGILSGDKAFKLYDTYGFPLDLTQDILRSKNIRIDLEEFNRALQEQKGRSKWVGSGESQEDVVWHLLKKKFEPTEFVGYEKNESTSKVISIVQNGSEVQSLSGGKAFLVTESTPFYAECGGQCGDAGIISSRSGVFRVTDTQKFCDSIIAHEGEIISGSFAVPDLVTLKIDHEKRMKIRANHTATHLLQAALRLVLGEHVVQRGSNLNEDRLRLDFSHNSAVSRTDLSRIENTINGWIIQNAPVTCKVMAKNEAVSAGAMALFGEKYGDFVRTVCVTDNDGKRISFELCGGTHASASGTIGMFKILSEASIGSGVRRIEAITRIKAFDYLNNIEQFVSELSEKLKCSKMEEVSTKIDELLKDLKQKKYEISLHKQQSAIEKMRVIDKNGVSIHSVVISSYNIEETRALNDAIRSKAPSGIVVIVNQDDDKVSLVVTVDKNLQTRYKAKDLLKIGLIPLNGNGGGNTAFAQGAGNDKSKISDVLEQICSAI